MAANGGRPRRFRGPALGKRRAVVDPGPLHRRGHAPMLAAPTPDRTPLMLDTPLAQVPTLSLATQASDPDGFAQAFGGSFQRFGFAIVADHGVPQRR